MKLIVNPHKIEIEKTPVNEKEVNITKCKFNFEMDVEGMIKEAYFTLDGNSYKKIIVNNECDIPNEVLTKVGQVELGVTVKQVQDEETLIKYNPSPAYFVTWKGSEKNAENSEPITPSEFEQYEQALQDGLTEVNEKLDDIDQALTDVNTAITETNNLDLDVSKEGKVATVTLTKKDATTKVVTLSDGTNLMFNWQGTSLGIKTDEDENYIYVDLQGVQGETGPMGAPFTIKKTYSSIAQMNADFNNMNVGDYVMITSTVETEDNAKLYCKGEEQWIFITDFSGATGIQGPTGATPNIQIGTVTSGNTPAVTRTGTNENPVLNFVLEKGEQGIQGIQGETGNGIESIEKTATAGLVDTYTITFTDNTTTTFTVTNGEVSQEQLDYVKKYANALIKQNSSGTDLTINDTAECPMPIELSPSELSQASEPTPSSPQDVHIITGSNKITTIGKNLLKPAFQTDTKSGITCTYTSNGWLLNGTYNGSSTYTVFTIFSNTLKAGTYCINGITGASSSTYQLDIRKNGEHWIYVKDEDRNFTITETTLIELKLYAYSGYGTFNNLLLPYQLELNATKTTYKPYEEMNYIIDLGAINIFDKNTATYRDGYVKNDNGVETTSSVSGYLSSYVEVNPNTKYTIQGNITDSNTYWRVYYYDSSKNWISRTTQLSLISIPYTFTTPNNCYYIQFQYKISAYDADTIQIEKGEIAGAYAPYGQPSLEYCEIGNYSDTFFKNTTDSEYYDSTLQLNKWYLKKNIGKIVLDGSEDWSYNSNNSFFYIAFSQHGDRTNSYCNYYKYVSADQLANVSYGYAFTSGSLRIKNTDYTNKNDFKNWLSTHNTIIYYISALPTDILLNDILQAELEQIYNWLLSYQDQTNITQTNYDLPFVINATTCYDLNKLLARVVALEEAE